MSRNEIDTMYFDLQTKLSILRKIDQEMTRTGICKKYEIVKSTLCEIVKIGEKIYKLLAAENSVLKSKKIRVAKYEDTQDLFFKWFKTMHEKSLPILGVMIREKASAVTTKFSLTL